MPGTAEHAAGVFTLQGTMDLWGPADAVVGLTASSHKKDVLTKAVFDHLKISRPLTGAGPKAFRNWISQLTTIGIDGADKHPADKAVILRRMKPDGSGQADIIDFNGGQGTINVNSWSPDSKHFAFVTYPEPAK